MKVIVVTTIVPFVSGGAEYMTASLTDALMEAGHSVERFELPFISEYRSMLRQTMALRLLDIAESGDRLIAIRTPSYVIRHHSKVVWFIHHHRPSFDMWGTRFQDVPANAVGEGYREAFRAADNLGLSECRAVYANSRRVKERLREFNGVNADVLYPPLKRQHQLHCSGYGDYILCPGRLTAHKRQALCIEAMRFTVTPVRLIVAGPCDSAEKVTELQEMAVGAGVEDKVSIVSRWLDEDEKTSLFAGALAVAYVPYDEDSYGYVSLEAAESWKAIITCSDSGGLVEFVENGVNGFVAAPEPAALAECFDRLWDRNVAIRMGQAAHERPSALNISWQCVTEALLA